MLLAAGAFVLAFVSKLWSARFAAPRWNLADVACVALLVSFSAMRFEVGTDYLAYQVAYDRLDPAQDWWAQAQMYQQDLGYTLLALATRAMTDSPHAIFWVTSAIAIVPVYATLRKQSKDLPFAVLLYLLLCFYVAPFNIIRQGMAFGLVFWGYSFIKRSKTAFIVIALIAASLHSTAIIVAAIMFLGRLWKPRLWSTVVLFAGMGAVAGAIWTVPPVRALLESLNERYLEYIDSAQESGITVYIMMALFLLLAILIATSRENERPDWLAMILIGIALLIVSTQSPVALRAFNYFGLFVLLALPNSLLAHKHGTILRSGVLVGTAVYFAVYVNTFADLVPYQSYQ
ncbi:EpsG family protein [Microbacterium sp. Mu-80]|uniref:EpsG family protein n=1 Tax=Microbacterium bandirmense TaxID=3122050 RepID=A0ABU8L7H7_9MICO